jgi:hypothetical protein
MKLTADYLQQDKAKTLEAPKPLCPLCGASLILLRGICRCSRCCFSFCESCDGLIDEIEPVG